MTTSLVHGILFPSLAGKDLAALLPFPFVFPFVFWEPVLVAPFVKELFFVLFGFFFFTFLLLNPSCAFRGLLVPSGLAVTFWPGRLLKKEGASKGLHVPCPFVKGKWSLSLASFVKRPWPAASFVKGLWPAWDAGVPKQLGNPLLSTLTSLTFFPNFLAFGSTASLSLSLGGKELACFSFFLILSNNSISCIYSAPLNLAAHCFKSDPCSRLRWYNSTLILSTFKPTHTDPLHLVSFKVPSCNKVEKMAAYEKAMSSVLRLNLSSHKELLAPHIKTKRWTFLPVAHVSVEDSLTATLGQRNLSYHLSQTLRGPFELHVKTCGKHAFQQPEKVSGI